MDGIRDDQSGCHSTGMIWDVVEAGSFFHLLMKARLVSWWCVLHGPSGPLQVGVVSTGVAKALQGVLVFVLSHVLYCKRLGHCVLAARWPGGHGSFTDTPSRVTCPHRQLCRQDESQCFSPVKGMCETQMAASSHGHRCLCNEIPLAESLRSLVIVISGVLVYISATAQREHT